MSRKGGAESGVQCLKPSKKEGSEDEKLATKDASKPGKSEHPTVGRRDQRREDAS